MHQEGGGAQGVASHAPVLFSEGRASSVSDELVRHLERLFDRVRRASQEEPPQPRHRLRNLDRNRDARFLQDLVPLRLEEVAAFVKNGPAFTCMAPAIGASRRALRKVGKRGRALRKKRGCEVALACSWLSLWPQAGAT